LNTKVALFTVPDSTNVEPKFFHMLYNLSCLCFVHITQQSAEHFSASSTLALLTIK